MKIGVIGLGVIGSAVLKELSKKEKECYGFDIDSYRVRELANQKMKVSVDMIKGMDVYVIAVYTTQQVMDSLENIDYSKRPLVCIESTINPNQIGEIIEKVVNENKSSLAVCPHRFNPGDKKHQIFNMKRVIGGATEGCLKKGIKFYSKYMPKKNLVATQIYYAALSKVVENAYRFTEIAIAEELKMIMDSKGLDFEELRKCANSKWNIDIKEARHGINGKCLPKDMAIFNRLFKNTIFNDAAKVDAVYKKKAR